MTPMWRLLIKGFKMLERLKDTRGSIQQKMLAECGRDVYIGRSCDFIYDHVHVGHHVFIGERASFIASIAHIFIGNYVMFGPNVTIRGGNHRFDVLGEYIYNVKEKLPHNDQDVVIEDDAWIGCNVTILKGVRIGRGAVVGAGSVVTKSVPNYAIVAGNPAVVIRFRFEESDISRHEELIRAKSARELGSQKS
jgi:acetyltransferase-like isoleucine patch superfamily enzyme